MSDFSYEIKEHIATLSKTDKGYTTELNLISFSGNEPKLDLRKWNRNNDTMLKGITLTDAEALALKEALAKAI